MAASASPQHSSPAAFARGEPTLTMLMVSLDESDAPRSTALRFVFIVVRRRSRPEDAILSPLLRLLVVCRRPRVPPGVALPLIRGSQTSRLARSQLIFQRAGCVGVPDLEDPLTPFRTAGPRGHLKGPQEQGAALLGMPRPYNDSVEVHASPSSSRSPAHAIDGHGTTMGNDHIGYRCVVCFVAHT